MLKTVLSKSRASSLCSTISRSNITKNSIKKLDLRPSFTQASNEPKKDDKEKKSYEDSSLFKKIKSEINNSKTHKIEKIDSCGNFIIAFPRPMFLVGTVFGTWYGLGIGCFSGIGVQFYPKHEPMNGAYGFGAGIMGVTGTFTGVGIGFSVGSTFATGYGIALKKQ